MHQTIVLAVLLLAAIVSAEHHYEHHEPAESYQNYNLHVGHQEVIKIPVIHHFDHQEEYYGGDDHSFQSHEHY
ncbi:hypothetical protein J6590_053651 [Homalodisca vitripennis]|nr:hypothetical protein J6590_053651 [Homalodisca vitripennis]